VSKFPLLFDTVIVATGCAPPSTSCYSGAKMLNCWDILRGKAKLEGFRVAVIGRWRVACETSELLARRRKKEVAIINSGPIEELGCDMERIFERRLLLNRLQELRGNGEVIGIGDCGELRNLYQAIHDGFRAGYRIG